MSTVTHHDHLCEERGGVDAHGHASYHLFYDLFQLSEISLVSKGLLKGLTERRDLTSEQSHGVEGTGEKTGTGKLLRTRVKQPLECYEFSLLYYHLNG